MMTKREFLYSVLHNPVSTVEQCNYATAQLDKMDKQNRNRKCVPYSQTKKGKENEIKRQVLLEILRRWGKPITIKELSEATGMTSQTISGLIGDRVLRSKLPTETVVVRDVVAYSL